MSLQEAIGTARSQSVAALEAKHSFVSTYWAYRSYQASRLPSLVLYGGLMNFDRSLTLLQSYEDGSFRYTDTYNQFKWDKLIEPKEYERGRRRYVESMEQVTINAVSAYFSLVQALKNQEVVKSNYENTGKMRSVAAERMN